jgi:hypothetical protein
VPQDALNERNLGDGSIEMGMFRASNSFAAASTCDVQRWRC